MNIVKNCMEHTPPGGTIHIDTTGNAGCTQFVIRDTGSGIPKEELPHIFERFYKAENASAQSVGIGLALAKQIISAHGGTVRAESRAGEGTRFTIRLYSMG